MKKLNLFIILVMITMSTTFADQNNVKSPADNISKFIQTTMKFNRVFPQEKVYMHFDNTGYFIGERIWFKAYVLSSDSNRYTHLSKVLYVELVNPSGDVLEQHKLEIKNGQAWGDFELKKVLISGFYEVRAYTRYMTNWGKDGIFSRVFPIFRRTETEGDYSKKVIDEISYLKRLPDYREKDSIKVQKLNVHFYPEGGKLIQGKLSKVAFDVTDENGAHQELIGMLINSGDTLKKISTIREGRGVFSFIPSAKPATLILRDKKGRDRDFTLPIADKEGCALRVNTLSNYDVIAELDATKNLQGQLVGMVITHNGTVMDCDTVTLSKATITHFFKKSKLADGVNQLTIINTEGQILADRMIFIYPRKDIGTIHISTPTEYLSPCKKVELKAESRPNTAFSLSVRDADTQTNGYDQNAATWLLLSSDLRGFIENPNYYLENNDEKHQNDADLLMMVQGWHRYDFEMMEGKNKFLWNQPVENSLFIDGKLHQAKKKNKVDNVDLTLTLYNNLGDIINGEMTTDQKGYYAFKAPDCYGEWNMLLRTKKENKDLKYYVAVNRNFSPKMRNLSYYESQELPIDTPNILLNKNIQDNRQWPMDKSNYLLKEVKVKGHRIYNQTKAAWMSETIGAYTASIYYDCDKAVDEIADRGEDTPSVMEWLKMKNPFFNGGTNQEGVGHYTRLSCNFYDEGLMYKRRPVVWIVNNQFLFVTGVPHKMAGTINDNDNEDAREPFPINLEEVKSIYISEDYKAYNRYLTVGGLEGNHPVTVFVYTHLNLMKPEKGLRRAHFSGFNIPTEYQNTVNDYNLMAPQPDYRRTLYWNPNVTTDKDGKAKIEFFNNSTCNQIVISAEGITIDGKAILYK